MSKKIFLQNIIEDFLKEEGIGADDSNVRALRRNYDQLFKNIGGDKEILEAGKSKIEYDIAEVSFMKAILRQLYYRKGLVWKIAKEKKKKSVCSTAEVFELINSIIDEERKKGVNEHELEAMEIFFSNTFLLSQLHYFENCHKIIDLLMLNLQDLTTTHQALYLAKVFHILKKELSLRVAGCTIDILEIAGAIELSKQLVEDEFGNQTYSVNDPEIRFEYIQRDKNILEKIKDDEDLRIYIEKKFGKKAEEIFNYAALGDKA